MTLDRRPTLLKIPIRSLLDFSPVPANHSRGSLELKPSDIKRDFRPASLRALLMDFPRVSPSLWV